MKRTPPRKFDTTHRAYISLSDLPPVPPLLPGVIAAVQEAGETVRAEFHRLRDQRTTSRPVLRPNFERDLEVFLRDRLLDLLPRDFYGEELPGRRFEYPDCWVVDPLDGTKAFVRGIRGSAISVALLRQGSPVLGVVFAPCAPDDEGDLFAWVQGQAPTRNGKVLPPIGPEPDPYCTGATNPRHTLPEWAGLAAPVPRTYGAGILVAMNEEAGEGGFALANHQAFSPGSVRATPSPAYRLALAAAGGVDVAIALTPGLDAYDIAGGHALLRAVGGELVQKDGRPITYSAGLPWSFNGGVGGRPELLREVVRRLERADSRPTLVAR